MEPAAHGRDENGRFTSGNTYGRGNSVRRKMSTLRHRLLDVAESHDLLPKLLGVLSNIAADKTTNAADRITAVKTIFEFCLGKPSEGIDLLLELDEIAADIIDGRLDAGVLDTSALVRQGLPVSSSED